MSASDEVIAGLVERLTFHSPESGFCVLRVKARGHRDLVTKEIYDEKIRFYEPLLRQQQERTHDMACKAIIRSV